MLKTAATTAPSGHYEAMPQPAPGSAAWRLRNVGERECYLTLTDLADLHSAREFLECSGWEIVRAFVFGALPRDAMPAGIPAVSIRHSTQLTRASGAVLHAVRDAVVTPVRHDGRPVGSCIETDASRELHLMNIGASPAGDAVSQARGAYGVIDDILGRYGFRADHVVRYWNYLTNIGDTYRCLNLARDEQFARHGITRYPAATGIESRLPAGQSVSLSLEAVRSLDGSVGIRILRSDLQGEAAAYGPRFSRGVVIDDTSRRLRKIHISGTSHLDRSGGSIAVEQPEDAVGPTLAAIEHLLGKEGATLADIAWSVVYCKDRSAHGAFQSLYDKNGWQFPYLPVFVNICRPELRFEMECFAAVTTTTKDSHGYHLIESDKNLIR